MIRVTTSMELNSQYPFHEIENAFGSYWCYARNLTPVSPNWTIGKCNEPQSSILSIGSVSFNTEEPLFLGYPSAITVSHCFNFQVAQDEFSIMQVSNSYLCAHGIVLHSPSLPFIQSRIPTPTLCISDPRDPTLIEETIKHLYVLKLALIQQRCATFMSGVRTKFSSSFARKHTARSNITARLSKPNMSPFTRTPRTNPVPGAKRNFAMR